MCCIQIHVLSDVGLHCSIVEEYILSSGLPFITVHTRRKNKNQQVESCLGNLICNVTSSPSFNCPLFLSGYAIYIYILYIYIYSKLVGGQSPDLQSRFPGVLSGVLPVSNKILGNNIYSGLRGSPCLRG